MAKKLNKKGQLIYRRLFAFFAIFTVYLICIMLITSCEQKSNDEGEDTDIKLYELRIAMTEAAGNLPAMSVVDGSMESGEELFPYLSDLSYELVDDYFFSYSSDGSPYELAVILLKDESNAKFAAQSLDEHISKRVATYSTDKPGYADAARKASVVSYGRCVALIMCDDNDAVKEAFRSYLEN